MNISQNGRQERRGEEGERKDNKWKGLAERERKSSPSGEQWLFLRLEQSTTWGVVRDKTKMTSKAHFAKGLVSQLRIWAS